MVFNVKLLFRSQCGPPPPPPLPLSFSLLCEILSVIKLSGFCLISRQQHTNFFFAIFYANTPILSSTNNNLPNAYFCFAFHIKDKVNFRHHKWETKQSKLQIDRKTHTRTNGNITLEKQTNIYK